ncbi:MAG: hypothetical protein WD757_06805 [Actinomycetota bacterium]
MSGEETREDVPLTDDEVRERMMADPDIRARVLRTLEESRRRSRGSSKPVTAEELEEFLREHG